MEGDRRGYGRHSRGGRRGRDWSYPHQHLPDYRQYYPREHNYPANMNSQGWQQPSFRPPPPVGPPPPGPPPTEPPPTHPLPDYHKHPRPPPPHDYRWTDVATGGRGAVGQDSAAPQDQPPAPGMEPVLPHNEPNSSGVEIEDGEVEPNRPGAGVGTDSQPNPGSTCSTSFSTPQAPSSGHPVPLSVWKRETRPPSHPVPELPGASDATVTAHHGHTTSCDFAGHMAVAGSQGQDLEKADACCAKAQGKEGDDGVRAVSSGKNLDDGAAEKATLSREKGASGHTGGQHGGDNSNWEGPAAQRGNSLDYKRSRSRSRDRHFSSSPGPSHNEGGGKSIKSPDFGGRHRSRSPKRPRRSRSPSEHSERDRGFRRPPDRDQLNRRQGRWEQAGWERNREWDNRHHDNNERRYDSYDRGRYGPDRHRRRWSDDRREPGHRSYDRHQNQQDNRGYPGGQHQHEGSGPPWPRNQDWRGQPRVYCEVAPEHGRKLYDSYHMHGVSQNEDTSGLGPPSEPAVADTGRPKGGFSMTLGELPADQPDADITPPPPPPGSPPGTISEHVAGAADKTNEEAKQAGISEEGVGHQAPREEAGIPSRDGPAASKEVPAVNDMLAPVVDKDMQLQPGAGIATPTARGLRQGLDAQDTPVQGIVRVKSGTPAMDPAYSQSTTWGTPSQPPSAPLPPLPDDEDMGYLGDKDMGIATRQRPAGAEQGSLGLADGAHHFSTSSSTRQHQSRWSPGNSQQATTSVRPPAYHSDSGWGGWHQGRTEGQKQTTSPPAWTSAGFYRRPTIGPPSRSPQAFSHPLHPSHWDEEQAAATKAPLGYVRPTPEEAKQLFSHLDEKIANMAKAFGMAATYMTDPDQLVRSILEVITSEFDQKGYPWAEGEGGPERGRVVPVSGQGSQAAEPLGLQKTRSLSQGSLAKESDRHGPPPRKETVEVPLVASGHPLDPRPRGDAPGLWTSVLVPLLTWAKREDTSGAAGEKGEVKTCVDEELPVIGTSSATLEHKHVPNKFEEGSWTYMNFRGREKGPHTMPELRAMVDEGTACWGMSLQRQDQQMWLQLRQDPYTSQELVWGGAARFLDARVPLEARDMEEEPGDKGAPNSPLCVPWCRQETVRGLVRRSNSVRWSQEEVMKWLDDSVKCQQQEEGARTLEGMDLGDKEQQAEKTMVEVVRAARATIGAESSPGRSTAEEAGKDMKGTGSCGRGDRLRRWLKEVDKKILEDISQKKSRQQAAADRYSSFRKATYSKGSCQPAMPLLPSPPPQHVARVAWLLMQGTLQDYLPRRIVADMVNTEVAELEKRRLEEVEKQETVGQVRGLPIASQQPNLLKRPSSSLSGPLAPGRLKGPARNGLFDGVGASDYGDRDPVMSPTQHFSHAGRPIVAKHGKLHSPATKKLPVKPGTQTQKHKRPDSASKSRPPGSRSGLPPGEKTQHVGHQRLVRDSHVKQEQVEVPGPEKQLEIADQDASQEVLTGKRQKLTKSDVEDSGVKRHSDNMCKVQLEVKDEEGAVEAAKGTDVPPETGAGGQGTEVTKPEQELTDEENVGQVPKSRKLIGTGMRDMQDSKSRQSILNGARTAQAVANKKKLSHGVAAGEGSKKAHKGTRPSGSVGRKLQSAPKGHAAASQKRQMAGGIRGIMEELFSKVMKYCRKEYRSYKGCIFVTPAVDNIPTAALKKEYRELTEHPICLTDIEHKLSNGEYCTPGGEYELSSFDAMVEDLLLMVNNCKDFNHDGEHEDEEQTDEYFLAGVEIEGFISSIVPQYRARCQESCA